MSSASERRPDSQQLVRQWALLRLLADATDGYSIKQLSEQLGVSKATIERDLATLDRDFALVEEQAGKQKKVYRLAQTVNGSTSARPACSRASAISKSAPGSTMAAISLVWLSLWVAGLLCSRAPP